MYIKHSDLKHVEFSRTGDGPSRYFELTLTQLKDDSSVTFLSIDRQEHTILMEYFKASGVKMKTVDLEGNRKEIKDSKKKEEVDQEMNDYDDEEESEDESFNDQGDSDSSEDDEADSEMIDSEVEKKELKKLQKETKVDVNEGRPKRTTKK